MMKRSFAALAAALLCLGASLSAAWLWHAMSPPRSVACARLVRGADAIDNDAVDESDDDERRQADEAHVLSPEVLSAATALLQERGVALSLPSPFDPITDYLVTQTRISRPERGRPGEICIRCEAADPDEALQMLKAIVDAYLASGPEDSPETDDEGRTGLQAEYEQLVQAIERQKQSIAELTRRLETVRSGAGEPETEDPAPLEAELGRVRQAHREAAARLADARREFDNRSPAERVAARIADVPTRNRVLERLNRSKARDELERQEALQQKWSAVYGRNHPRMAEIRERIAALEQQLAGEIPEEPGHDGLSADSSPAAIVLAAFEDESANLEQAEQQLVTRLGDVQERFQGQQELELQLGEARQELAFLQTEFERTHKQVAAGQRDRADAQPSLISPPAIDRRPNASQARLPLALSGAAGLVLYFAWLWRARNRWRAADRQEPARERPAVSRRRERFRSKEEQQLMRLKLAARGSG